MKNIVFFRADGNSEFGLGHLVRCMALAQMLQSDFKIVFVSKEIPDNIINEIVELSFKSIKVETEEQFLNILTGNCIVVLDHYGLGTNYQKIIKDKGCGLVCIDDLHDKDFYADLIINHAPGILPEHYKAQHYTQFALGVDYVLLRPVFLEKAKQPKNIGFIKDVFVCFGGSDGENLTQHVINVLKKESRFKNINVVVGSTYLYLNNLKQSILDDSRFHLYHAIKSEEMASLMMLSGLAIVPCSSVLMEVLALHCRVISGMYIDNQKIIFNNYKKIKAFISADDFNVFKLKAALDTFFKTTENGQNFIDGKSNLRLLKVFKNLEKEKSIHLRKALESDLAVTFKWATDKSIRTFSFNQSDIDLEGHSSWFLSKIKDKSCYYYIVEMKGDIIGSIRFDRKENEMVVSYLVDSSFHNKGLGISVLKMGINHLYLEGIIDLSRIVGYVQKENIASNMIFEKLYFTKEEQVNFNKYILIINKCK